MYNIICIVDDVSIIMYVQTVQIHICSKRHSIIVITY